MNSVDYLREFKRRILRQTELLPLWKRLDIRIEVEKIYQEILEEMIGPEEVKK